MINLGILGCSEIAFRRFMPAVLNVSGITVKAVAEEYAPEKLTEFCETYQLEAEKDFLSLIEREDIDAVYVPQPPALHHKWAKIALEHGKHVLIEKPSTISYEQSRELVELAKENNLALHENYMFQYHSQIAGVQKLVSDGAVGDVRLIRADFGFPMRAQNDFRYNAALGGGALLDAGGYTAKLATLFLGETVKVDCAKLNYMDGFEVDMYGNATLSNEAGQVCQLAFGMDNSYRCSLEVWGSTGRITTNRIFTAPPGFEPMVTLETPEGTKAISLEADSHFEHSIEEFVKEVSDQKVRAAMYQQILVQAQLVEDIRKLGAK